MVFPFLVAGAVYFFQRLSGTVTVQLWERTGLVDALREGSTRAGFPWINTLIDINERFAYTSWIELLADATALGAKVSLVRAGLPLVARLPSAIGARQAVLETVDVPGTVQSLLDFINQVPGTEKGDPFARLGEFGDRVKSSMEKLPHDELGKIVQEGGEAIMDSIDAGQAILDFAQEPSIAKGVPVLQKVSKAVTSFFGWLGNVLGIVEEVQDKPPPKDPPPIPPVTPKDPPGPPPVGIVPPTPPGLRATLGRANFLENVFPGLEVLREVKRAGRAVGEFLGRRF